MLSGQPGKITTTFSYFQLSAIPARLLTPVGTGVFVAPPNTETGTTLDYMLAVEPNYCNTTQGEGSGQSSTGIAAFHNSSGDPSESSSSSSPSSPSSPSSSSSPVFADATHKSVPASFAATTPDESQTEREPGEPPEQAPDHTGEQPTQKIWRYINKKKAKLCTSIGKEKLASLTAQLQKPRQDRKLDRELLAEYQPLQPNFLRKWKLALHPEEHRRWFSRISEAQKQQIINALQQTDNDTQDIELALRLGVSENSVAIQRRKLEGRKRHSEEWCKSSKILTLPARRKLDNEIKVAISNDKLSADDRKKIARENGISTRTLASHVKKVKQGMNESGK